MKVTAPKPTNYRLWLAAELASRRQRNPSYSLRAFAKHIGVSPATMSQLMAGKRALTPATAARLAERLNLDPEAKTRLLGAVPRRVPEPVFDAAIADDRQQTIELETFRMVADWYHFAILSLARLKDQSSEPAAVASRLGISRAEASAAIQRLIDLKYVRVRRGRFERLAQPLHASHEAGSAAIRSFHGQMLELASASLTRDDAALREFSALTLPLDPALLPSAKQAIREFKNRLDALLEGGKPSRVYALTIQLFPLEVITDAKTKEPRPRNRRRTVAGS